MLAEFIGRNLIFLTEVESTNSYAMQLLKNVKPVEGTVVYTHHQTKGRGQRSKVWESEPGLNVTMSTILYPDFLELKNQYFLYQIVALACYDTISAILIPSQFDIKIKWPNDILVNRKKLCGILIENNLFDSKLQSSILGIGLNVNQNYFSESNIATSLSLITGKDFDCKEVLLKLCSNLSKWYTNLKLGNLKQIQKLYESKLYGLNSWEEFVFKDKTSRLKVVGLAKNGLLLLEDSDKNQFEADTQGIKWIL